MKVNCKLIKGLFLLSLISTLAACGGSSSSQSDISSEEISEISEVSSVEELKKNVTITIKNQLGVPFDGIDLNVLNSKHEVVLSTNCLDDGVFDIQVSNLEDYYLDFVNLPSAYEMDELLTVNYDTEDKDIIIYSHLIDEPAPDDVTYDLGDIMYDTTFTDCYGNSYTFSEVLSEKDFILLNFWATWCTPCRSEFPDLNEAYAEYNDVMEIFAISDEDAFSIKKYQSSMNLDFPMGYFASLETAFQVMYVPTTVVIDRYGMITFKQEYAMSSKEDFTSLFDQFIGSDYQPKIIESED